MESKENPCFPSPRQKAGQISQETSTLVPNAAMQMKYADHLVAGSNWYCQLSAESEHHGCIDPNPMDQSISNGVKQQI